MPWWIYFGPVAGALLGFVLVGLARRFLFHPATEKRFGPLRIQGLLWKRRAVLTREIAVAAAGFIDIDALGATITAPESVEKILPQAEAKIDEFLRIRLVKAMPVVGMFVGDKTINQLKSLFVQELKELFPEIMRGYLAGLQQDLDIPSLFEKKLDEIPPEKILQFFNGAMAAPWRYAMLLGGLIGFLSGLFQLLLVYLAGS